MLTTQGWRQHDGGQVAWHTSDVAWHTSDSAIVDLHACDMFHAPITQPTKHTYNLSWCLLAHDSPAADVVRVSHAQEVVGVDGADLAAM